MFSGDGSLDDFWGVLLLTGVFFSQIAESVSPPFF